MEQELPTGIPSWILQQAGMRQTRLLNNLVCSLPQLTLKEGLTVYREQVRQLGQKMRLVGGAHGLSCKLCCRPPPPAQCGGDPFLDRASNSCPALRHSLSLAGVCGQHTVQVRTLRPRGGGLRPAGGAAG